MSHSLSTIYSRTDHNIRYHDWNDSGYDCGYDCEMTHANGHTVTGSSATTQRLANMRGWGSEIRMNSMLSLV